MDEQWTTRKRVHENEDGHESPNKRQATTPQIPHADADLDGACSRDDASTSDQEQIAVLESRIDMLEDLLFQWRGDNGRNEQANASHNASHNASSEPSQPLVSEIDAAIQPPPLPDWASRARRPGKKAHRPAIQRTRSSHDDSHEMLEMTLRNLEKGTEAEQLSLPHDDDDILIRGVLHGWDSASRKHRLDRVWRFLRMFDLYLYKLMSPISKLAALRALRSMLVHRMQPCNQTLRPIPSFFEPTELQKREKHSCMIDYFAWPSVRDHLIRHSRDIRSIPRAAQTKFAQNFVFDWPYEFEDAFMTIKSTGRFVLSEEFKERWNDLRYWTITAFDDTNFIPTHLQMDKKRLTACQTSLLESKSYGEDPGGGDQDRFKDVGPSSSGRILDKAGYNVDPNSEQPAVPLAHSDTKRDERPIVDEEAGREALDEWSWYFSNTRETYETIKSLFEIAVPS